VSVVVIIAVGSSCRFVRFFSYSSRSAVDDDNDYYDVHRLYCCTVLKFNKCKNNRFALCKLLMIVLLAYCCSCFVIVIVVVVVVLHLPFNWVQ